MSDCTQEGLPPPSLRALGLDELRSRRNRGPVPKPKTAPVPKPNFVWELPAEIARRNPVPAASVGGRGK